MNISLSRLWRPLLLLSLCASIFAACGAQASSTNSGTAQTTVHLGYFPNLTHAVAIVGVARGTFAQAFGSGVKVQTTTFNAGPSLIEALFARSIDIGYVGPNPAINGYIKSQGAALRIIAGASSGGALFVVRPEAHIQKPADLAGKKLATPQLGGTQDVALRHYLQQQGLKTADKGGNVQVVPTDNPNIVTLFQQSRIDGAWVPEPWATRLVAEQHGQIFLDERTLWPGGKFVTTNVVVSKTFYDQHPDLVKKFLQGHIDTVQYIQSHQTDALNIVNSEIKRITGSASLPPEELSKAFANLDITYDPLSNTLIQSAERAYALGFLGKNKPDLKGIYALNDLNAVLTSRSLAPVAGP
ncbi:MAG: ABC transporter substrate-binding protein [Ktedonobacteraceae bacterium]|nr:ABC transporter substrate-binding protein [Ktedonobacteraceae bacterium]